MKKINKVWRVELSDTHTSAWVIANSAVEAVKKAEDWFADGGYDLEIEKVKLEGTIDVF